MTVKPGKGHRVLVVGCERALVRYFAVFLKIFSYQVTTAKSFPEASREAQKPTRYLGRDDTDARYVWG
jgi:hypothetical protein